MKLFNFKKDRQAKSQQNVRKDIFAQNFEKGYAFVQRKWARWMARKAGGLPRQNLFALLILFTVVSMTYCVYLIASSFSGKVAPELKVLQIDGIYNAGPQMPNHATDYIPKDTSEIYNVKRIRRFMDSLARSPTGRKVYDSITTARPGLLDSLSVIEKIYKLKSKN